MDALIHFRHRFLGFRHLDLQSAALVGGVKWDEEAEIEPSAAAPADPDLAPLPRSPHTPLPVSPAHPADPPTTPFWRARFPDESTAVATAGRANLVKARERDGESKALPQPRAPGGGARRPAASTARQCRHHPSLRCS